MTDKMETLKEEINTTDNHKAFDEKSYESDENQVQDDFNDSNTERLSASANFQRGNKLTRSLGRSFKRSELSRSGSEHTVSEAKTDGKNRTFLGFFFSPKNKKATYKEQTSQLQAELEILTENYETMVDKCSQLQIDNDKLTNENTVLKNSELRLKAEVEKVRNTNKMIEKWNEEILFSVGQALKSFGEFFDKFDIDYEKEEHFSVDNLQIGSGNTQNIITADLKQFRKYQKHLENIMQELQQTKQNLNISKTFQENMGKQILTLDGVLEEVKLALTDVKNTKKEDVSMELLDYTLSWTEPRLMSACVYELKNLPNISRNYLFTDLTGNAKIGVLRIFKKYEKRIDYRRFVQRLEMEDIVELEMWDADKPLTRDECAALLVKWASLKQENDAETLVEIFPRIKPGRNETKGEKATFPFTFGSMESLNSNDHFRERLIEDVKEIVREEILSLKPEMEEIKSAMSDTKREPKFV